MPKNKKNKAGKGKKKQQGQPKGASPVKFQNRKVMDAVMANGGPVVKRLTANPVKAPMRVSAAGVSADMDRNALIYVGALTDASNPLFRGARVPDAISVPTCTATLVEEVPITTSLTQHFQIYFRAQFSNIAANDAFQGQRTAVAGVYPAFTPAASNNAATVAAACASYRTVGFTVELIPTTPLSSRAGLIRMTRVGGPGELSTAPAQVAIDPNTFEIAAADANIEKLVVSWLPEDYDDALEFVAPGADSTFGTLALEFPAAIATQTYTIRAYHMIEYIPFIAQRPLVETASVVGDEGRFATAWEMCKRAAGVADNIRPGTSGAISEAAISLLGAGLGALGRFAQSASASGIASMSGLYTCKRVKSFAYGDHIYERDGSGSRDPFRRSLAPEREPIAPLNCPLVEDSDDAYDQVSGVSGVACSPPVVKSTPARSLGR